MRRSGRRELPERRQLLKSSVAAGLTSFTAMKTAAAPTKSLTLTAATVPDPSVTLDVLQTGDVLGDLPTQLTLDHVILVHQGRQTSELVLVQTHEAGDAVLEDRIGEAATALPAMVPFAPGRLSNTTGWPSSSLTFCPKVRASKSVPPPAATGTMI